MNLFVFPLFGPANSQAAWLKRAQASSQNHRGRVKTGTGRSLEQKAAVIPLLQRGHGLTEVEIGLERLDLFHQAVHQFLGWLGEVDGVDWTRPPRRTLRAYLAELDSRGLSRSTIGSRIAALRFNGENNETGEYECHGYTALLDNMQAMFLSRKLPHLQECLAGIRIVTAHNRRRRTVIEHQNEAGEYLDANDRTAFESLFAAGAAPADSERPRYGKYIYWMQSADLSDGTVTAVVEVVDAETDEILKVVNWTAVEEADHWKLKTAPLP